MTSRFISFLPLLNSLALACGLDPAALATVEAAALADFLGRAADELAQGYDYPDFCRLERRDFYPYYSLAGTYELGQIVYDGPCGEWDDDLACLIVDGQCRHAYYQSLSDANSGHPVEDGAYWQPLYDVEKRLPLIDPEGLLPPMDTMLGAYTINPACDRVVFWSQEDWYHKAEPVGYFFADGWAVFDRPLRNYIWLRYQLPCPQFSATPWLAGNAYNPGDVVYLPPQVNVGGYITAGDSYLALQACSGDAQGPALAPTRWLRQALPKLLKESALKIAKSHWLSSEGQDDRSAAVYAGVESTVDRATSTLSVKQGQTRRYKAATMSRGRRLYGPRSISA